jgi:DDE superfamily endonuclease.
VYKTIRKVQSVDFSRLQEYRKEQLLKIIECYEPKNIKNIYNADDTGLFCMLPPNKTLSLKGDPCNGGEHSRKRITNLLACNVNGTDILPPVIKKSENPQCYKIVRKLPINM